MIFLTKTNLIFHHLKYEFLLVIYLYLYLYIKIRRTIDKLAHRPNAPPDLVNTYTFGRIEFFFVHKFNNATVMLAYTQLTTKPNTDNVGRKYFTRFSTREFIDIRCVDHCVGFAKI